MAASCTTDFPAHWISDAEHLPADGPAREAGLRDAAGTLDRVPGDGRGISQRDGFGSDGTGFGNEAGTLCVDRDNDGYSTCAGDCDDADDRVHPQQEGFFSQATRAGGFDFDCSELVERRYPDLVSCTRSEDGCEGDGWRDAVPDCGARARFVECRRSSYFRCATGDSSDRRQECR